MPALLTFDVSHTDITDEDLANLGLFCPNLRHFRMAGCADVTDTGLTLVAANCTRLVSLDLSADVNGTHPMRLSNVSLVELIKRCPDVTKLHLTYSTRGNITKRTLVELNDWRIANQGKMVTFNLNDEIIMSNSN
jgi:hypothetical protein